MLIPETPVFFLLGLGKLNLVFLCHFLFENIEYGSVLVSIISSYSENSVTKKILLFSVINVYHNKYLKLIF